MLVDPNTLIWNPDQGIRYQFYSFNGTGGNSKSMELLKDQISFLILHLLPLIYPILTRVDPDPIRNTDPQMEQAWSTNIQRYKM